MKIPTLKLARAIHDLIVLPVQFSQMENALSLPKFGLNWLKNSFTYKVAKVWNSLKPELRQENLSKFMKTITECKF